METAGLRARGGARALQLMAAGLVLSWCVNVRLPAQTPLSAWLLPSADVAVLLGLFALFAPRPAWRLPRALTITGALFMLLVRLGRIADGISQRYLDRRFHVSSDLPLVPEFGRLALSTLGPWRFALALALLLGLMAGTWLLSAAALRTLARALSHRRAGNAYLAVAGALALLGPLLAPAGTLYAGPIAPRVQRELEQVLQARGIFDDPEHAAQRRVFHARFRERQAKLTAAPRALERTGKVDVHVLLVEAYGHTVQATKPYAQMLAPSYAKFERQVASGGFAVCTQYVRATIFGGGSWLTHATLETGVPMSNQFDYTMFMEHGQTSSLAKMFHAAGYRAVSVKPGTTRASPQTEIYGYDREYAARDLGYRGPAFAWAPMPDQFALERYAELELKHPKQPVYALVALVSSHFPFNPHPSFVEDWTRLGDGRIWNDLPRIEFKQAQGVFSTGMLGYLSSIAYDLRVTSEFITRYVRGDALVLVLGDHQPILPVAAFDTSRLTPMHVLSRRGSLLAPFRARGCVPGMRGDDTKPVLAMEDLGISVLSALSGAPP
jgi:hypothetical protein